MAKRLGNGIFFSSPEELAAYVEQVAIDARIDELNRHKSYGLGDRLRNRIIRLKQEKKLGLTFIGEKNIPKTVKVILLGKSIFDPSFEEVKDFSEDTQFMIREAE